VNKVAVCLYTHSGFQISPLAFEMVSHQLKGFVGCSNVLR